MDEPLRPEVRSAVRRWRAVSVVVLALAAAAGAAAVGLHLAGLLRGWVAVALAATIGLLLLAQIVLVLTGPSPAGDAFPPRDSRAEPPLPEARVTEARCAHCGTRAEVVDTRERPLLYACPGCGATGVAVPGPAQAREDAGETPP